MGVDLMPYLTGQISQRPHETLYWRFGRTMAVRHGDYKLVVSKGGSGQPELYNLRDDIGESKDLAAKEPAKVAELTKLYKSLDNEQAAPSAVDNPNKKRKWQEGQGQASGVKA